MSNSVDVKKMMDEIDRNIESANKTIDTWILLDENPDMSLEQITETQAKIVRVMALKEGYKIRRQELIDSMPIGNCPEAPHYDRLHNPANIL